MKAARFYRANEKLRIEEVPVPKPGPTDVIVKVHAAGICGSDVHIVKGHTFTEFAPIILGHEGAGVITEIGDNVQRWNVGDRVCINCVTTCGICYNCLRGRDSICLRRKNIGRDLDGVFAEYVKVNERNLIALPDSIPFDQGAIITDAVATPYHAVVSRARLSVGEKIVVYGLGGIGLHAVSLAKIMGAGLIVGVDVNESAMAAGKEFGADEVFNPKNGDFSKRLLDLTAGDGFDVAIECVGIVGTIRDCIEAVKIGGRVVAVGLGQGDINAGPLLGFVRKEVELMGSSAMELKEISTIVDLVHSGRLDLSKSVTKRVALSEVNACLDALSDKKERIVRMVIVQI
ncbi:MAG TPA: zinc-binding dehydrogenase [Desulfobacteraceae bacterium]|nr:zinc-binding dehydrogenase [Desulfobacteraceae bacterium]HPJ66814.1 zinc-binding dehydrogenase [Desulfobacteraceae bacterium]HPQ27024.1 zinc-binding dehydrogenase [Desulfobacteraceae bacterium]